MSEISGIQPDIRNPVFKMAGYPLGQISGKTVILSIPNNNNLNDKIYIQVKYQFQKLKHYLQSGKGLISSGIR